MTMFNHSIVGNKKGLRFIKKRVIIKLMIMKYFIRISGIIMLGVIMTYSFFFIKDIVETVEMCNALGKGVSGLAFGDSTKIYSNAWDMVNTWDTWLGAFLLIAGWGYLIGTKLGFQIQEKQMNIFYKACCILLFVIFFAGSIVTSISCHIGNKQCEQIVRIRDSINSKPITQRNIGNCQEMKLVTKYEDGYLKYIMTYPIDSKSVESLEKLIVYLYDEEGFILQKVNILLANCVVQKTDNKKVIYLIANGSTLLNVDIYEAISSYNIAEDNRY